MTVIALCGRAGSGKDTAADILLEKIIDYPVERYALARPIKELAKNWLGWKTHHVERVEGFDREAPIYIPLNERFFCLDILIYDEFNQIPTVTPEKAKACANNIINAITEGDGDNIFLNKKGTEKVLKTTPRKVLQVIGTEGFRDTIDKDFWLKCAPRENVVITDVRFPNELDFFRDAEATIIHIERDRLQEVSAHESEQDLIPDKYNLGEYIIKNNGTLADLQRRLEDVYDQNDDEF